MKKINKGTRSIGFSQSLIHYLGIGFETRFLLTHDENT